MLTWRTAWEVDNGVKNTESAAHAKRFAADSCMEITTDAVQVFGGYGYSEEYPVARLMRAAKVLQIYEGSSQVQRMIIGREMTRISVGIFAVHRTGCRASSRLVNQGTCSNSRKAIDSTSRREIGI